MGDSGFNLSRCFDSGTSTSPATGAVLAWPPVDLCRDGRARGWRRPLLMIGAYRTRVTPFNVDYRYVDAELADDSGQIVTESLSAATGSS